MIRTSLAVGAAILLTTELFGALGILSTVPVLLAWATVLTLAVVRTLQSGFTIRPFSPPKVSPPKDPVARFLWMLVSVLLIGTLITGLFSAPNAWDSLTYHLPRVERWAEQGTLQFWPTSVDRQLWSSPWTEYAILQLRLLTGSDRLAALPSWAAYLGCIWVSAAVVRRFGGTERQVALGALVSATFPVAILHASSARTDLPAAFWVLCAAALVLEAWQTREQRQDWRSAAWIGLAAGLAVATKGTAWLALAAWLAWYAAALWRVGRWRSLGRSALVGILAIAILNGPLFGRNIAVFGDPLGDALARQSLRLTPVTPASAIANLLANLSLHLGLPSSGGNLWMTNAVLDVQRSVLHVDPAALFPYFGGFRIVAFSTHETLAGNPLHLGLVLVVAVLLFRTKWRPTSMLLGWVLAGLAALLIHSILIRWQPFGARLQLPALIWLAPAVGALARGRRVIIGIGVMLFLAGVPALVANHLRPLLPIAGRSMLTAPRADQYFTDRPDLQRPIERALQDLQTAGCREVGLSTGYDAPEYLLRALARMRGQVLSFRHVSPAGPSAAVPEPRHSGLPCAIIVLTPPPGWTLPVEADGMRVMWDDGPVAFLLRSASGGTTRRQGPGLPPA